MNFKTENELLEFGEQYGQKILHRFQHDPSPIIIELTGDVGVGKTTFTRGLARGLGVDETVTSPSFTICKRYNHRCGTLAHFDFYRLSEPGLMLDDLVDTISEKNSVSVIEWGETIENVLPKHRDIIELSLNDDESRSLILRQSSILEGEK